MKKRMLAAFVTLCMVVTLLPLSATAETASSGTLVSTGKEHPDMSRNIHAQDYEHWSSVSNSYLFAGENNTICRLDVSFGRIILEQFDETFQFIDSWIIPLELPIFGGFYAGKDAYYVICGQENPTYSDTVEVIRVVKYSKDKKRLGAASLYGGNTKEPFCFSGTHVDENGDYLYIRTGHTMYPDPNGINHQANMTLILDTKSMRISNASYEVSYISMGYVSHSFKQFIHADGKQVIGIDHGDGYPRGIALTQTLLDSKKQIDGASQYVTLFPFSGNAGDNNTGASLGGFEMSDDCYLVTGNTIDQTRFGSAQTRNVFLSIVDKDDFSVQYQPVTNYAEGGDSSASTPQMVKLSDDLFAVMWEEKTRNEETNLYSFQDNNAARVAFFDGSGTQLGNIQNLIGSLSDCQPVLLNGYVTWWVADGLSLSFYRYRAERSGHSVKLFPDDISSILLTSVTLGETLQSIDNNAFQGFDGLVEIEIPASVTRIGWGAFRNCQKLQEVVLPHSQSLVMEDQAFLGCRSLTHIKIPEGVTSLSPWIFAECILLDRVEIPSSVTKIEDCAFYNTALKDVYYAGTEAQWNQISIGTFNEKLTGSTIHYQSSMPDPSSIPPFSLPNTPSFTDVPLSHWAYPYIEEMSSKGIVNGIGNGHFNPQGEISPAEFSSMIARAFWPKSLAIYKADHTSLPDWWTAEVETVRESNGFLDTSIRQKYLNNNHSWTGSAKDALLSPMTRYDMAAMLRCLLDMKHDGAVSKRQEEIKAQFSDWNQIPSLYQSSIIQVVDRGLMKGKFGGTFSGEDTVTRAEAATVLSRVFSCGIRPDSAYRPDEW